MYIVTFVTFVIHLCLSFNKDVFLTLIFSAVLFQKLLEYYNIVNVRWKVWKPPHKTVRSTQQRSIARCLCNSTEHYKNFIGLVIANEQTGKFSFYAKRLLYMQFHRNNFITYTFCIKIVAFEKPKYWESNVNGYKSEYSHVKIEKQSTKLIVYV